MNPAFPRRAGGVRARALASALACVAALAAPRAARAQCEPAPRRADPLAQAVAKMHAPKKATARPRIVARVAPKKTLVTHVAYTVAPAKARPVAAPRRKPVARKPRVQPKPAPRPVVCRTDSTMGMPPLPAVTERFGAVPESPFVAEVVASDDGPTLAALEPLPPLPPMVPRIPVVGPLPGTTPGVATGLTVVAAGAGGIAWHFFWRPAGDPMRWNPGDRTPGGKPPVGVPSADTPERPTPPSVGDDTPPDAPTPPRDSITVGGTTVGGGSGGGNGGGNGGGTPWTGGPPGSGEPLFPDPIPGAPFPEIPLGGDPYVPAGGPSGGPPTGPQSAVPEPATGGLILAGAIAIGLAYTRKRRPD